MDKNPSREDMTSFCEPIKGVLLHKLIEKSKEEARIHNDATMNYCWDISYQTQYLDFQFTVTAYKYVNAEDDTGDDFVVKRTTILPSTTYFDIMKYPDVNEDNVEEKLKEIIETWVDLAYWSVHRQFKERLYEVADE